MNSDPKNSHPIHPVLVHFPIAFLLGSSVGHVVFVAMEMSKVWEISLWLLYAGVITSVPAALAGGYDFYKRIVLLSRKELYEIASWHIILMMTAVFLYVACLIYIVKVENAADISPIILLGLSLSGAGTLIAGGWFGGEMVHRK